MLISYKKGILNTSGFEYLNRNGYKYYYSGVIWMRGSKAGKETVQRISEIYENSYVIPFNDIFGSFYFVIQHPNGKLILFTDNSNMHSFFIGKKTIGTNFLEVMREDEAKEFNTDGLCEFFEFGGLFLGRTLISNIELSDTNKFYICENEIVQVEDKGISDIDGETSITDVNVFFQQMSYSLSDMRITLALSGGYDSRMVFASLYRYIPLNVFVSGDNMQNKDIIYSQKVANAAGCNIDIIKTPNIEISSKYIESLFEYAQGLAPFIDDGYIRISEFFKNRAEKGFNCILSGDGGGYHKDNWWMQDFPRYRKKSFDFNRFYAQRFNYLKKNIPWGSVLEEKKQILQQNMVKEFSKFKKPLNTQTYDSLYFNFKARNISINYSIDSNYLWSYAPLMERELIRYSYHLPRRSRFFYNSMRKIITKASKDIARIPTNHGTTASSERLYILRDILFQGVDYFKRACRLLGRKLLNKTFFVESNINWTVENKVRSLPISKEALEYCIKSKFIKKGTKLENISFSLLGKLIQVYLLAQYLGTHEN